MLWGYLAVWDEDVYVALDIELLEASIQYVSLNHNVVKGQVVGDVFKTNVLGGVQRRILL